MLSRSASLVVLTLTFAGAPCAYAQMYKWVDERGVTNYSNEPPSGVPAQKLAPIGDRMSTYSAPPSSPSASTGASGPDPMRERVQALERQLEEERRQRDAAGGDEAERRKRAYDECIRARGVDCDQLQGQLPSGITPAVVFLPARRANQASPLPPRQREPRPQPRQRPAPEPERSTSPGLMR